MQTTLVSVTELAAHLDDPAWIVVDVRHDLSQPERWGEEQYRAGHIPGALFAHLDRDLSGPKTGRNGRHPLPTPEAAAATFGRLGIEEGRQVVAYDQRNGAYASRLWWMLRWLGPRRGRGARRRLRRVAAREGCRWTTDVPRAARAHVRDPPGRADDRRAVRRRRARAPAR